RLAPPSSAVTVAPGAGLHGETLAPLCASGAEYGATIRGTAAHEKAVRSRAPRLGWLVGSLLLHGSPDPKKGGIRARALKPCQIKVFFLRALWIRRSGKGKILL